MELTNDPNPLMSRIALNDNKAGMEGLDKERINQIIFEASKGSKFFENEKRKEEQLNEKILEQQKEVSKITANQLAEGKRRVEDLLHKLSKERDLSRTIVHVDMDAFYAAVEMRDDPTLRNKPMAVGGMGMLSTSNYLARRYGVRAAMPGFIGLKLCPDLVLVKPNFHKYTAVSQQIREVIGEYDSNFCPMSLDEAYLDLTEHLKQRQTSSSLSRAFLLRQTEFLENTEDSHSEKMFSENTNKFLCTCDLNSTIRQQILESEAFVQHASSQADGIIQNLFETQFHPRDFHPPICPVCERPFPSYVMKIYGLEVEDAVLEMRNRIEQRTQLTASAGIAPNTMLAKVCSDRNKPNGQFRIKPLVEEVEEFIKDLPIRKISGIGKVTEKLLCALGVVTCSDLKREGPLLYHVFSPISFQHFMDVAAGIGSTTVERDGERKSISTERTFSEIYQPSDLIKKCLDISQALSEDMKEEKIVGKTVTLKVKTVDFEVRTRSHTLSHVTNEERIIAKAAQALLQTEIDSASPGFLRLRLMGVRMSKLESESSGQISVVSLLSRARQHIDPGSPFPSNSWGIPYDISNSFHANEGKCKIAAGHFSDELFSGDDVEEDFRLPFTEDETQNLGQLRTIEPSKTKVVKKQALSPSGSKNKNSKRKKPSANLLDFLNKGKQACSSRKEPCSTINNSYLERRDSLNCSMIDSKSGDDSNHQILDSAWSKSSTSVLDATLEVPQSKLSGRHLAHFTASIDFPNSDPSNTLKPSTSFSEFSLPLESDNNITAEDENTFNRTKLESQTKFRFGKSEKEGNHSSDVPPMNSFRENSTQSNHPDKSSFPISQHLSITQVPDSSYFATALSKGESSSGGGVASRWSDSGVQQTQPSTTQVPCDQPQQNPAMVSCPVCGVQKLSWCLDQLNVHIDLCLSRQTVKELLKEETRSTTTQKRTNPSPSGSKGKKSRREMGTKTQASLSAFFKH